MVSEVILKGLSNHYQKDKKKKYDPFIRTSWDGSNEGSQDILHWKIREIIS